MGKQADLKREARIVYLREVEGRIFPWIAKAENSTESNIKQIYYRAKARESLAKRAKESQA